MSDKTKIRIIAVILVTMMTAGLAAVFEFDRHNPAPRPVIETEIPIGHVGGVGVFRVIRE